MGIVKKNRSYFFLVAAILLLIFRIQTGGPLIVPITAVIVAVVALLREWYIKRNKN